MENKCALKDVQWAKKGSIYQKLHHPHCSWSDANTFDLYFHLLELEPLHLLEKLNRNLS